MTTDMTQPAASWAGRDITCRASRSSTATSTPHPELSLQEQRTAGLAAERLRAPATT